jgi:hypothetical protein
MVFCPPKTNTFEPQHSDSQGVSLGSFAPGEMVHQQTSSNWCYLNSEKNELFFTIWIYQKIFLHK